MHRAVEDIDRHEREMGNEAKLNVTSCTVRILGRSTSETPVLNEDGRMHEEADGATFPRSSTNTGLKLSPSYVTHPLSS